MQKQTMTLSRALRYKKRVLERIRSAESDVQSYNSVVDGAVREADVSERLQERSRLVDHLIELKQALQDATRPIMPLVFELAETKSDISFWQRISTVHGKVRAHYRDEAETEYNAIIRKPQVDEQVRSLQDRIDSLQTKIDAHNADTTIEISVV